MDFIINTFFFSVLIFLFKCYQFMSDLFRSIMINFTKELLKQKRTKTQAGFEPPIPIFEIRSLLSARAFSLSVGLYTDCFPQGSNMFYFRAVRLSLSLLRSKMGLFCFPVITDVYGAFWGGAN